MNLEGFKQIIALTLPVTAVSVTLTKASIFEPVRGWVNRHSQWLGKLISCPYCLSHWAAFLLVAIYQPVIIRSPFWLADMLVSAFAIVALSSPLSWLVFRSFKTMEPESPESDEIKLLREALVKAKQKIIAQEKQISSLKVS